MTVCVAGIDPGLKGAISFYFPSHPERVSVEDMPVAGGAVDCVTLAGRIRQFSPTLAVVERVHPGKGWGSPQVFKFAAGWGGVIGILAALEVPTHLVLSAAWKKYWKVTSDKDTSRALALRLFPAVGGHFSRKKDDGRAEAALIARYGAEVLSGLIPPDRSLTRHQPEVRT